MELKGKIIKILPVQSGTSARGEWRKQEFIIEIPGTYPKQVCVYMWGDMIDQNPIQENEEITASIDIESREYNGRWYTNVRVWRIEKEAGKLDPNEIEHVPKPGLQDEPQASQFSEPRMPKTVMEEDDDLPF